MNKFIKVFEKKGIIATIIGLIFAIPVNARLTYLIIKNSEVNRSVLEIAIVMNLISMIWFMLPSEISINFGKFNIIIKD